MARVRHLQGPNLKNPYSGWDMFAKNLSDTSQNVLNRHERADVRTENNAFRDKSFDNTVKNQDRNYGLNVDKFIESQEQNDNNNNYRDMYFGYKKDIDNRDFLYKQGRDEVADNKWENQFDFNKMNSNRNYAHKVNQSNKPNYTTFNGVDAEGNPVLSVFNKNDGTVQNTNAPIYQKPKEYSPNQQAYYAERANEIKQKQQASQLKMLRESPNYINAPAEIQQKAENQLLTSGQMPTINYSDGGYLGFEDYSIALTPEQKKVRENQLADDMKILMQ